MNSKIKLRSSKRQHGQAAFEYIVGCVVVLIMLGVLNLGFSEKDTSIIDTFLEKVDEAYTDLSSFLSVPL